MTALWQILFIGLVSNLDNLGVGVAYGARRIAVPPLPNLLIAAVAFLFTLAANWFGAYLGQWLPVWAERAIGAGVLILIGLWVLFSHWRPGTADAAAETEARAEPNRSPALPGTKSPSVLDVWRNPEQADHDSSGAISLGESVVLGVALAMNCLTNGFVTGLWGLGAVPAALSNAGFSYLSLAAGARLGSRYAAPKLGDRATVAAACLLILLGLGQLFGSVG